VNFRSIQRCRDITDEHINAAIDTRGDTRDLLEHAVGIAKPREAGARVLLVFAKMASPACDWLDGALRIELARDGARTAIESFTVIGAGLKERVFPRMVLDVPLDEFTLAIEKYPRAIAPMAVAVNTEDKLTLTAEESAKVERREDAPIAPPPALGVADLPTVGGPPAAPLAKLKLERKLPALKQRISEESVTKPRGDTRRDATGEFPAMPIVPLEEPPEQKPRDSDDVDTGWD